MTVRLGKARWRRMGILGTLAFVLVATAVLYACSQTPPNIPVRTFERAQRMDVACLRLYDPPSGGDNLAHPREPIGRPQVECMPAPSDAVGASFDKQLFALVTQTARGELAVVDLSAGGLIDQSRAAPGINFLPVGANPTDVAVTPDGKMAFVASAEINKPAIYGIPTRRMLGDTAGFPRDNQPISLGSWPVCALPQNPGAISVVPRRTTNAAGDGGATASGDSDNPYDLVVVLPGDRLNSAKVLTLDPRPFRRGGLRRREDGKPDYASDVSPADGEALRLKEGTVLEPGTLEPCSAFLVSAVELVGGEAVPTAFVPGPAWEDGVKYADAGADLTCKRPAPQAGCGLPPCCPAISVPLADGGAPQTAAGAEAGACEPIAAKDAGPVPLDLGPLDPPKLVSLARDEQTLYIADEGAPLIHVLDLTNPSAPRELPPLLATSETAPERVVKIKDIAISPPTRDYKRFLYAVDRVDGSIMVFDVTDPNAVQRSPQRRPHPELNPFVPPDRIAFGSPVVAVSFARHDVPLGQIDNVALASAPSGLLCNPNPRLESDPRSDFGFYYRADRSDPGQDIGPVRLRGIFGFATLASGQVVTLDVDDWDAPCRRPADMSRDLSDTALAQTDRNDKDPYHAPTVTPTAVTNERFFPMSAPHSPRSADLITTDSLTGDHVPRLAGPPSVSASGVVLPQVGIGNDSTPILNVRFAFDEAHVHTDQDWSVTYEGALPGFDDAVATISTTDDYSSLTLTQTEGHFCAKGVEDWALGIERTNAIKSDLAKRGLTLPLRAERWMTDYVQISDDLLDASDDYWNVHQTCWEGTLAAAPGPARHNACERVYGAVGSDQKLTRDFPIVEAYDDHFVLGRYYTPAGGHREVVYTDPSNAPELKLMQCCFRRQARFRVRTGQMWGAVASGVGGGPGLGFFSHLTPGAAGRCVPSCDPREVLLNGRMPTIPVGISSDMVDRNSPIALRNPMFSAVMLGLPNGREPLRDTVYTFSSRGQFRTLAIDLAGDSISVNPQSMRFVEALGQMAVVDGASQGLMLIDLRSVTVARAPYF